MNILHVTPYYAPAWSYGGVVSAVTGLAEAQAKRGHGVTVLTTDVLTFTSRNPKQRETIDNVQIIRCRNLNNTIRARYNFSQPPGLWRTFRSLIRDVDIVHTHELRTAENLLIGHQKPIVLSPHGTLSHETGRGLIKRLWDTLFGRMLLRRIDGITALTEAEAKDARTLWQQFKVSFPPIEIIPNGVPDDFAASIKGNLRDRYNLANGVVVLFLGRLHERKGLQYLIPAFASATQNMPDARLLIVGPDEGMLFRAQALVQQHNIADRVTFTGLLQGADQRAALATSDIFVLPAVGEGLSMAALEAMAAGLPLILTPGCNLPNVEQRGAGLLVERDREALAVALRTLLNDPAKRAPMGKSGQQWVKEQFTWPVVAERTEQFYADICTRFSVRNPRMV